MSLSVPTEKDALPAPSPGVRWQDEAESAENPLSSEQTLRRESRMNDEEKGEDANDLSSMDSTNVAVPQQPAATPSSQDPNDLLRRPTRPRLNTSTRGYTDHSTHLPPLKHAETALMQKEAHPFEHLGITLGLPAIILFDIVVPCIIYYTWYNSHTSTWKHTCLTTYHVPAGPLCPLPKPSYDKDILGYAIISFGFGELWILIARVYRLYFRRDDCAPLLSRSKYELDATSWVYATAMIVALIPFVVGSSLVMPHLYLYGPSCLMGFLGLLMLITACGHMVKIPIGINSHARGTGLRPFIYYAAEDFIAVDGLQDREFRVRYNERYESNKAFRRMFLYLTIWWIVGVAVYIGCVSAVIWTLEFHYAFGASLGVLFSYIAIWAGGSYLYVKWEVRREHRVFEEGKFREDRNV